MGPRKATLNPLAAKRGRAGQKERQGHGKACRCVLVTISDQSHRCRHHHHNHTIIVAIVLVHPRTAGKIMVLASSWLSSSSSSSSSSSADHQAGWHPWCNLLSSRGEITYTLLQKASATGKRDFQIGCAGHTSGTLGAARAAGAPLSAAHASGKYRGCARRTRALNSCQEYLNIACLAQNVRCEVEQ